MFRKRKVLCYVLVFDQVDIIKKCLNFLTTYSDQLELVIVENPSDNTPKISKFIESLGKKGLIKRYYLFSENITSNAVVTVFEKELELIEKNPYVIITDGDLVSNDKSWLKEELNIMKMHPEVFACGISLDMSNLPLKSFPEAASWIPVDKSEEDDFYETATGGHLLMMRGNEFSAYHKWRSKKGVKHIDSEMFKYCYNTLNMKWVRTKKSKAYHLTWDLYADKNHPYTKFRLKNSFKDTWYHKNTAKYELKSY
jgi:hypothetical protein